MRSSTLTLGALALILGSAACKKDKDEDPSGTSTSIVTNKDSVTYRTPALKLAKEVRFRAFVAWDPVLGEVVSPVIDGNDAYRSVYKITLYEEGWSANDESTFCDVNVVLHGYGADPDARNLGFAWGMIIPAGPKDTDEDCTSKGFDVADFAEGWKVEEFAEYQWTLRFYAGLTAELEDWLTPDTPPTDFEINQFTGGDWSSDDAGFSTEADSNYWYGYAMDDLHNVDFDTPLDSRYTMVDVNGDMAQGYYVFDQRVYWFNE